MESFQHNQGTKAGMIGGLLFVFVGLSTGEIVKTAVLATIGATVSFIVTMLIKWISRRIKRRV